MSHAAELMELGAQGVSSDDTWRFRSTPKPDPDQYRSVPAEQTLAHLLRVAPILPVTRIADLTPLDRLSLPVFSAVTPFARDLTVHAGKGVDRTRAKVSALMEAVERVSAESTRSATRHISFQELQAAGDPVVDPQSFDLPDRSAYTPERKLTWVQARELASGEDAWIPLDLVISPPYEGILLNTDTNGLASGNTPLEAVVHAICEVVERDAISQLLFAAEFGGAEYAFRRPLEIGSASLPASAAHLVDRIESAELEVSLDSISTDMEVPVVRCTLTDRHFPSPGGRCNRQFAGFGAAPDPSIAVLRAITEAVQSRLSVIQGARDSYNRGLVIAPEATSPESAIPITALHGFRSGDLLEDFNHLVATLRKAGFNEVYAFDLTRPEFGFAVVRIRVPGLSSFVVSRDRVNWRCLRHLLGAVFL